MAVQFQPPARARFNRPARVPVAIAGPSPSGADSPGDSYRRQARRLRQRYAGDPALLHLSLRELSRRHDAEHPAPPVSHIQWDGPVLETGMRVDGGAPVDFAGTPSRFARAVVEWFSDQVADTVDNRLVHYSQRQAILKTARRLGISRFHANLIIAVAQNDSSANRDASVDVGGKRPWMRVAVAAAIIVQGLIAWGAWRLLHG